MLTRYFEKLANLDYRSREQKRLIIVAGITLLAMGMSLAITFIVLLITGKEMLPIIFLIAALAPALIGPVTSWHVVNLIIRVQKLEEEHRKLATFDDLTGLLTRRALIEQGEALLSRCQGYQHAFSLAILDLDNFKSVNDQYGHAGGDAVLQAFAGILCSDAGASDLVGRLGGEEFAMVLPACPAQDARARLETVRLHTASASVPYMDSRIGITTSIGLASATVLQGETFAAILKRADDALYQAKASGRNQVIVANVDDGEISSRQCRPGAA